MRQQEIRRISDDNEESSHHDLLNGLGPTLSNGDKPEPDSGLSGKPGHYPSPNAAPKPSRVQQGDKVEQEPLPAYQV